ncbi:MAG: pyruvate carboxylase subunit B [Chloroflexi bacterium]|nr:pyruvate carboxylase subunit B [Chloroflexota bacterium]
MSAKRQAAPNAPKPAPGKAPEPPARPVKITDVTFRDGHQSVWATRMRTEDMEPVAEELDRAGFHSVEVWGGATFDVCTRFLGEDPWDRVRRLKRMMPKTPLQMLLRGQNLVGYRNYADDVVRAFVDHAAEVGMDIFRVFDALNDERNMEAPFKAIKETGKHIQACICYSLTERRMGGEIFNLEYYLQKAQLLQDMGADSLCIKDMAGIVAPFDVYDLVTALKGVLHIPIQLHSHYTSGMAAMTALKAIEAGVDIVDTALAPLALRSSHPAAEPLAVTLQGTPWETPLDLHHLLKIDEFLESIAPKYRDLLDSSHQSVIDTAVLEHQVPGGMISNLVSQLREAGALDRIQEVYEEIPRTRKDLGYPPLVTPTSQIVGIQAVQNVLFGRYKMISAQVKDYCYGLYGRPPRPIDPEVQRIALKGYERGEKPITGRPGDILQPELGKAKEATKGLAKDIGDVLTYALYPTTGQRFLRWKYGLEPVPPEVKPKALEDIRSEDELIAKAKAGKLVERPQRPAPEKSANARTFNVFIDGQHFEVEVDPVGGMTVAAAPAPAAARPAPAAPAAPSSRPAATPAPAKPPPAATPAVAAGETALTAPMPGMVIRYEVQEGASVKAGDVVVILEAMKMENALPAPRDGVVKALTCAPGVSVQRNAVLAILV